MSDKKPCCESGDCKICVINESGMYSIPGGPMSDRKETPERRKVIEVVIHDAGGIAHVCLAYSLGERNDGKVCAYDGYMLASGIRFGETFHGKWRYPGEKEWRQ
jgi:hypothetical protein